MPKKNRTFTLSARVLTSVMYIMAIRNLLSMPPEEAEKLIRWAQRFEGSKIAKREKRRKVDPDVQLSAGEIRQFVKEYEALTKEFVDFRSMIKTLREDLE